MRPSSLMLPLLYNIYMGGCQNYGPLLGTLNIRCRIITGIQRGTIILKTTHMSKQKTALWDLSGFLQRRLGPVSATPTSSSDREASLSSIGIFTGMVSKVSSCNILTILTFLL